MLLPNLNKELKGGSQSALTFFLSLILLIKIMIIRIRIIITIIIIIEQVFGFHYFRAVS